MFQFSIHRHILTNYASIDKLDIMWPAPQKSRHWIAHRRALAEQLLDPVYVYSSSAIQAQREADVHHITTRRITLGDE